MSDKPGSSRQDPMIIAGSQESQSRQRDTVSSRDLDNLVEGLLGSRRARAPTVDPAHRPNKPQNPLSHSNNVIPVTHTPKPDDPIQTAFQRTMLDAFTAGGRWGLVGAVYEEAKQRYAATNEKTWQYLIDDYEGGDHYMLHLLCMLPDEVIVSLIRNTLPSDYESNSSKILRSFVDYEMNPSSVYAGIYLNITTRAGPFGFKQLLNQQGSSKWTGKWLSSKEVAQMLDRVEMYMENKQTDERENTGIDNQFLNLPTTLATPKRRFEWKKEDRIETWVAEMRRLYCTKIAPADTEKSFLRCPSEVGFAINIRKRLDEHRNNSKTTPIFGLVNAITRQAIYQKGFGFPEPWGVVLWPLWLRDVALSQVAESFGHVLCSSYWYAGGFNFHGAGYSTVKKDTIAYDDAIWTKTIEKAGKRIDRMLLDAELKRAAASDAQVECLLRLTKSLARRDGEQTKADESTKKLEDARRPLREEESKIRKLHHQVEAEEQGIRSMTNYIEGEWMARLLEAKDKCKKTIEEGESEIDSIKRIDQEGMEEARLAYASKSRQDNDPSPSN